MAQLKQIRLGTMRLQVRSLASLSGLRIWCCRELCVGRRRGSDPKLLWLWCRPAATALIRPLAWEPPYAVGVALEKTKRCPLPPAQKSNLGVPVVAQQKRIQLGTMRLQVRSLASLSGLMIWRCCELWCRP